MNNSFKDLGKCIAMLEKMGLVSLNEKTLKKIRELILNTYKKEKYTKTHYELIIKNALLDFFENYKTQQNIQTNQIPI